MSYTCFLFSYKLCGSRLWRPHQVKILSSQINLPEFLFLFLEGVITLSSALLKSRCFIYSIPLIEQTGKPIETGNKCSLLSLALGELVLFSRNHNFSFEFTRNYFLTILYGIFMSCYWAYQYTKSRVHNFTLFDTQNIFFSLVIGINCIYQDLLKLINKSSSISSTNTLMPYNIISLDLATLFH